MSDERSVADQKDRFKFANIIAWIELQPKDKVYDPWDCDNCLFAQYQAAIGMKERLRYGKFVAEFGTQNKWDDSTATLVAGHTTFCHPQTFGAALERARQLVK